MGVVVLIIGVLLLLMCNPLSILWGGILILISLPVCLSQFLDYFWNVLVAMFTFDLMTLFQLIKDGVILVGAMLLILIVLPYLTGGHHGKH